MQGAIAILTLVGGLVFSVSCALLAEELIFGGLFRFFFQAKTPKQAKPWFVGSADKPVVLPVPVKVESREVQTRKR